VSLYVVGLDGLTFDLVEQWADTLENLQTLRQGGAATRLDSVHPPITGPAWISVYTGLDPSVYNRYHFNHFDRTNLSFAVTSRSDLGYEYFWERLEGQRTCLLNLPMTYPPSDRDDTIVCGHMGAPESVVTKPESLVKELRDGGVPLAYHDITDAAKRNPKAFMSEGTRQFEVMSEAWHSLESRSQWDLFFAQFSVTDWSHHFLWDEYEQNPADPLMRTVYERADEFLGEVLDSMDSDDNLVILSDHGGGKCEGVVYLNELLRRRGLLVLDEETESTPTRLFERLKVTTETIRHLDILGLLDLVKDRIPDGVKNSVPSASVGTPFRALVEQGVIDWESTEAYILSDGLLFCDGEEVRDTIKSALAERGLEVEFADLQSEYSTAPEQMPEYVVYVDDLAYEIRDGVYTDNVVEGTENHQHQGSHRQDGVFIGYGPAFDADGQQETGAWLPDVAPTLLSVLGEPIPSTMTGRPLTELLSSESSERIDCDIRSGGDSLSNDEASQVNDRLENLGYLG